MDDLSLIPLDDLIAELAKRFDSYIFCGTKDTTVDKNNFSIQRRYGGNRATCIANTEIMKDFIKMELYGSFKPNIEG